MKRFCFFVLLFAFTQISSGETWYVDDDRPDDSGAGTDWSTAKRTIQAAVDVADNDDTILVGSGTYSEGGRTEPGYSIFNRIVVDKGVIIRAVNGRGSSTIVGGTWIRCVSIKHNDAVLESLVITGGQTQTNGHYLYETYGGGIHCEDAPDALIKDCLIASNYAYRFGGGALRGNYEFCEFQFNNAGTAGGGVCYGNLYKCIVNNNEVRGHGGGAYFCTMLDCDVRYNKAGGSGGGVSGGFATNCVIEWNSANSGGGVDSAYLYQCEVSNNTAKDTGGGVNDTDCHDCLITENAVTNEASGAGGGAYAYPSSTLVGCTISANTATWGGGGVYNGILKNCIIYGNQAEIAEDDCYFSSTVNCCTPDILIGFDQGSTNLNPLFNNPIAGDYTLQPGSPCIGLGVNTHVETELDLAGRPRIIFDRVDMGAYEHAYSETDYDGDMMLNTDEIIAGTDLGDPDSKLAIIGIEPTNSVAITWIGGETARQLVEMKSDLVSTTQQWVAVYTNEPPTQVTNSFIHSGSSESGFYRINID